MALLVSQRGWIMPKKISPEVKARAVRMVAEHQQDYSRIECLPPSTWTESGRPPVLPKIVR
jgi:hypothetical protein